MGKLDGKVCVITGASQGIGAGMARKFLSEGARLALCARNATKLTQVATELRASGAEIYHQAVDVSDESQVERFFDGLLAHFGGLDVLVNNAGAFDGGPPDTLPLAAWNNVIGSCLTGTFLCSRRAFAHMKQRGGGRILNIGSISAQRPRENSVPYAAAKFGVWGLTQALALDGRPHGIVCSCLHPGNVLVERRTESGQQSDAEPMMSIDSIAEAALAMISLPADVNFLEAIVLPVGQDYLGRG
ncbi:MAG: SDR family oxidoreductase [Planctomycetaceae bacterium]